MKIRELIVALQEVMGVKQARVLEASLFEASRLINNGSNEDDYNAREAFVVKGLREAWRRYNRNYPIRKMHLN